MAASSSASKGGEFHIASKYRLVRKIGSGSFGDIYLGINVANGEVCYNMFELRVIVFYCFISITSIWKVSDTSAL